MSSEVRHRWGFRQDLGVFLSLCKARSPFFTPTTKAPSTKLPTPLISAPCSEDNCHRTIMTTVFKQDKVLTLEEALAEPRKHRDMKLAAEPMPNFSSTPGAPLGLPLSFRAAWSLPDRPRRIALLMDDCQEEYRPYAAHAGIIDNLVALTTVFREKKTVHPDGVACVWSTWSRQFDDGISNAMDRWYGSRGLRPENPENAVYVFEGKPGLEIIKEIAPTEEEKADGWFYMGKHLDMFWNFTEDGKSYLDEKLKSLHIDTIVIAGLWTDECIISTAYAGLSRGYDVVVVSDATATATANHELGLKLISGVCCKVLSTEDVVSYMKNSFELGEKGKVKGVKYPDGRIDD